MSVGSTRWLFVLFRWHVPRDQAPIHLIDPEGVLEGQELHRASHPFVALVCVYEDLTSLLHAENGCTHRDCRSHQLHTVQPPRQSAAPHMTHLALSGSPEFHPVRQACSKLLTFALCSEENRRFSSVDFFSHLMALDAGVDLPHLVRAFVEEGVEHFGATAQHRHALDVLTSDVEGAMVLLQMHTCAELVFADVHRHERRYIFAPATTDGVSGA